RVNELEEILARQDAAVKALRSTVSEALLGFENNGLTVEIKQGKVYVSLEESLLFASGSTNVDARGPDFIPELVMKEPYVGPYNANKTCSDFSPTENNKKAPKLLI
ncbi:MAG: hypothetical protein R6U13_03990, partial [Desulfatiglandaceae bacterium]